jgi:hypothetical protein
MQPVAFTGIKHFYVALQIAEVGAEQRGGNELHKFKIES